MGWDSIKDIYYKKLIKQISGDIDEKDGDLLPEYIIIRSRFGVYFGWRRNRHRKR